MSKVSKPIYKNPAPERAGFQIQFNIYYGKQTQLPPVPQSVVLPIANGG